MRKLFIVAVAFVLSAVTFTVPAGSAGQADRIETGKKVFATQKCSICHGIAGTGSKMSPLDGVGTKLTAVEIKAWITDPDPLTAKLKTKPKVKMKKYALPDAELEALVAYMVSLKK